MLSREAMVKACDAYLAAVKASDAAAMMPLFSADATIEDPIGAPLRRGHDEVCAFYSQPRDIRSIRRVGPVTVSGNSAAFQFVIRLTTANELPGVSAGTAVTLLITDVLTFDENGLIAAMVGVPDGAAAAELPAATGAAHAVGGQ